MFNEYEETTETNEQKTLNNWDTLEFEEIEDEQVDQWKPEKTNDFIIGRYISTSLGTGRGEGLRFHIIEDQQGNEISILGCTVLDNKLEKVEYGTVIKIIFKGMATSERGRDYKNYDVLTAKG